MEARMRRQCERRGVADLAAALDPVEDAAAELAPRIVGARAALQPHRRDVRAGSEAQIDVDQRQAAAEIEMQRAARLGRPVAGRRRARRERELVAPRRRRPGPGRRRPRPRR